MALPSCRTIQKLHLTLGQGKGTGLESVQPVSPTILLPPLLYFARRHVPRPVHAFSLTAQTHFLFWSAGSSLLKLLTLLSMTLPLTRSW